jgi:hypothetical protein
MAVGVLFEFPGVTQEQYDEVLRRMTDGGSLTALSDWPVEGVLFHVAGPTPDGWRVLDVWESEEAFGRFAEDLVPHLQAVGMPDVPPNFFPVYNLVKE